MKRVIIVRHAKSVPYGYDNDFYRDLTERGISDAEKISSRLKEMSFTPDMVIASPATRAMRTASIFCKNLGYDVKSIHEEPAFYGEITTQGFIDYIQQLNENIETVFIFGHNPAVYYLVYNMVKYFNADMPTCSTVALDFDVQTWKDVSARGGKLAFQLVPKGM
jgi:phosphohistidine phosphatase